jgi:Flp pilus assembly protein TadD
MDWLALLDRIADYYQWRRDRHPPYPDLLLERGLFHDLRGRLKGKQGAADIEEADGIQATLDETERAFPDIDGWRSWRLDSTSGKGEIPTAEALATHFHESMSLTGAPELESLLELVAPLESAPAPLRSAALCPAFRRLFATMAEYFTHRDQAEDGRRLYAWAALCGTAPTRHWLYRAKWERRAGDGDAVAGILSEGLGRFPDDIELTRALAEEQDRQGDLPAAIALLERAVERRPDWPDLRYELARLLGESEHAEASLLQIGKALELNPGYTNAAITRAELLISLGEVGEAESQLQELQQRNVASERIYELLSQIYLERQDVRRAEQYSVLAQEIRSAATEEPTGL